MPATKTTRSRAGARPKAVDTVPDASWMTGAACTNRLDLPWIADAETTTDRERLVMATVCAGCPVLTACERFATDQDMTGGFWAGTSRGLDTPSMLTGPGWTIDALPGLDTLPAISCSGGAA
jgi:hypothetical protein